MSEEAISALAEGKGGGAVTVLADVCAEWPTVWARCGVRGSVRAIVWCAARVPSGDYCGVYE